METVLNFLRFTDTSGVIWNLLAYIGMTLIITAVVSAKWRNAFFVWGPFILLIYAWLYLHNPVLTGLQVVITTSGILNFFNFKKWASLVVIILGIAVFGLLLSAGKIDGLWNWFGALGLLCIALGLAQLPKKSGFIIMTFGGLLIVIYAFALHIWAFFILNAIFFIVNVVELRKKPRPI